MLCCAGYATLIICKMHARFQPPQTHEKAEIKAPEKWTKNLPVRPYLIVRKRYFYLSTYVDKHVRNQERYRLIFMEKMHG